jgi:rare lipoprotein A
VNFVTKPIPMRILCFFFFLSLCSFSASAQLASLDSDNASSSSSSSKTEIRSYYGTASYYADKFNGRKTANGEVYSHAKLTAACNVLALGTWIRVTNLRNNKTVIVQVNDRLHPKNKRIVDLSKLAAEKLGYISRGLTQVKVEVLGKKKLDQK